MRLDGKIAIVTGGASGFGAGIVRHFVAEGARVLIADRDADAAAALAMTLDGRAVVEIVDVADAGDVTRMVASAEARLGPVDILVNNAGIGQRPQALEEVEEDAFERLYAVNMRAIYLTLRTLVPRFKARSPGVDGIRGVVLNIASTGGVSPRPRLAWYNASKGWVIAATRATAIELAGDGIRVNALNPVAGETPLLATFMGEDTPAMRARFLASIPLGRFARPDDIAHAACYLCSDEASLVSGVCMDVDGGRCF